MTELEVFTEHVERYRSVTLQFFDMLSEEGLRWRPVAVIADGVRSD